MLEEFKKIKFNLSQKEPFLPILLGILAKTVDDYTSTYMCRFLCSFNQRVASCYFFFLLNMLVIIPHISCLLFITVYLKLITLVWMHSKALQFYLSFFF